MDEFSLGTSTAEDYGLDLETPYGLDISTDDRPASVPALPVSLGGADPIAAGDADIFGSAMGWLGKLTEVGGSVFTTVSTLDAKQKQAELETKLQLAAMDRQSKLDDAGLQYKLAQFGYLTKQAGQGVTPAAPMNWNLILLGGLGLVAAGMILKRKR